MSVKTSTSDGIAEKTVKIVVTVWNPRVSWEPRAVRRRSNRNLFGKLVETARGAGEVIGWSDLSGWFCRVVRPTEPKYAGYREYYPGSWLRLAR